MQKKNCLRCGCPREVMISAKIQEGQDYCYSLKWLCFPCFFKTITGTGLNTITTEEEIRSIYNEFMKYIE